MATKEKKKVKEIDDLTIKQFRRVQEAIMAVPMAQHDKDLVLRNVTELLTPQGRASL